VVLKKWDRCQNPVNSGLRPDEDLLHDLQAEGFSDPLLFRTCAQYWAERSNGDTATRRHGDSETGRQGDKERTENGAGGTDNAFVSVSPCLPVSVSSSLPEGEQFPDLVHWLGMGLTRLEIEAIKARGVGQLLHQLQQTWEKVCPPDLADVAGRTKNAWERLLAEESRACADVLLNTLEP